MNEKQIYKDLGEQLRDLRKKARLTQADLALRVGLSRTSVTNIEKGRQHIPFHMVLLLADAVGVSPISLMPEFKDQPAQIPIHVDERISKKRGLEDHKRAWVGKVISSAMKKEDTNEQDEKDS